MSKMFLFEDFFHPGKQKKFSWGEIGVIGKVGYGDHRVFGQKLLTTQCGVGRWAYKSPIMKWANVLKDSWFYQKPFVTQFAHNALFK